MDTSPLPAPARVRLVVSRRRRWSSPRTTLSGRVAFVSGPAVGAHVLQRRGAAEECRIGSSPQCSFSTDAHMHRAEGGIAPTESREG